MKRKLLRASFAVAVLVLMLVFTASLGYAATSVTNAEEFTPTVGTVYCVNLYSDTSVTIVTDAAQVRYCGSDSAGTSIVEDSGRFDTYYTFENCEAGNNYFKFTSVSGPVTFIWDDGAPTNSTLETAEAISLAKGETKTVDMPGNEVHYYTMDLEHSGKYTFQTDGHISVFEGKTNSSSALFYENSDSEPHAKILPKGVYTIEIYSPTGDDSATIKRENWTGIDTITCNSTLTGIIGKTVTFKVKYSPANADSQINIKSGEVYSLPEGKVTKVSQKDGVATFKIKITDLYDKDKEKKYRSFVVSTEEGLTKTVEEKGGPRAATIEKKAIGYVYGGQITISNGDANKFAIQLKVNGKWKTIMKDIDGAPGSAWVDIIFYNPSGKKYIKPGKQYTARIVSYADSVKGATKQFKFITAYNTKPTNLKGTCTSCKFVKGKGEVFNYYKWAYEYDSDKSVATVKFTFKKAKKSQGTLIGDTIVTKSGKKIKYTFIGKIKKATKHTIVVRSVRKKDGMIAYGPTVNLKVKIKKAT